jgi:N-acetylglutamate synthase-like GNAT family acetyltransferase
MSLALRLVLPKDEAFVQQLVYDAMYEQLCAWAWNPQIREPLLKMQIDAQKSSYHAMFPHAEHAIIEVDQQAVGRMILDRTGEQVYVVDITILAKNCNAGLGSCLLRAVCTEAEMMRKPVRLQVLQTNRAITLYRRLGFQVIEDRQVAWLMERAAGADARAVGGI